MLTVTSPYSHAIPALQEDAARIVADLVLGGTE